jgi:XRE family aerobic/anaerobic benzoate catabolism transcriptional regulator
MTNQVQHYREERRLSQAELANMIGVTQPFISHIERGRRNSSLAVGLRLSHALGVPVDELFPTH